MSARHHLRAATRDVHERLHGAPAFRALSDRALDRSGYRDILARLWGFYHPLEIRLAEGARSRAELAIEPIDYARSPLLRADLAFLGLSAGAIDAIPVCPRLPDPDSPGALLGILYVLEGSALGGREIARGLGDLLPPGDPGGRRFFAGDRPRGALWRACCAAIEGYAAADDRLSEVVAAAQETFFSFELWLDQGPDVRKS